MARTRVVPLAVALALAAVAGLVAWRAAARDPQGPPEGVAPPTPSPAADAAASEESGRERERGAGAAAPRSRRDALAAATVDAAEGEPEPPPPSPATALRGRVLDPDGGPVAEALVLAFGERSQRWSALREPLHRARTDPDGAFRIDDADPFRPLELAVQAEGFLEESAEAVPGADLEIVLERAFTVRGRVLDAASGAAVPDTIVAHGSRWDDELGRRRAPEARTDAEGRWALDAVGTGRLHLTVRAPGRLPETHRFQVTGERLDGFEVRLAPVRSRTLLFRELGSGTPLAALDVQINEAPFRSDADGAVVVRRSLDEGVVSPGPERLEVRAAGWCPVTIDAEKAGTDAIEVPMSRGARLVGTVRNADGSIAAGARIQVVARLDELAPGVRPWALVHVLADEDGRFVAEDLPPRCEAGVGASRGHGRTRASADARLPAAGGTAEVELVFPPGAALRGTVRRNGAPAQADVFFVGRSFGQTATNALGEYLLEGLPSGETELLATRGGVIGERVRVVLEEGRTLERDLALPSDGLAIAGRVLDADRRPLRDVRVRARVSRPSGPGDEMHVSTTTDGDGRFELVLPAGDGRPRTVAAGSRERTARVEDVAPGTLGLELVLPETGRVRLRVVDEATGEPAGSVWLVWVPLPGEAGAAGRDLANPGPGGIHVAELALGRYVLLVIPMDESLAWRVLDDVRVEGDDPRVVEVAVPRSVEVELRLVGGPAEPSTLEGVHLSLAPRLEDLPHEGAPPWASFAGRLTARFDGRGVATFRGLAPGEYRIERRPRSLELEPETFVVPPVERHAVELTWRARDGGEAASGPGTRRPRSRRGRGG